MLDQYFDLLGACAQGGAQAFGSAVLLLPLYLILLLVMLAALIVACCALLSPTSYAERSDGARRWRMWERFRAAWAADEAAEAALRLTAYGQETGHGASER